MHVFLCGPRHIGKSTIVKNVIRKLASRTPICLGGFVTHTGRGNNMNIYISSAEGPLKYEADNCVAVRNPDSAYPFPQTFDSLGVSIIEKSKRLSNLICMDELGFFESEAYGFQDVVLQCLGETLPIIGVVKEAPVPWLEGIKNHPQVELITLTKENRDHLVSHIISILESSINKRYNSP